MKVLKIERMNDEEIKEKDYKRYLKIAGIPEIHPYNIVSLILEIRTIDAGEMQYTNMIIPTTTKMIN